MKKTFDLQFRDSNFRKWEMVKSPGGLSAIVIKSFREAAGETVTVYPYKSPNNKWLRILKFKWLKLRVWLKIIK